MYTKTEIGRIAPQIINKIAQHGVACLMLHFESENGAGGMYYIASGEVHAQYVSYKSLAMIITLYYLYCAHDTVLYLLGAASELGCDGITFI